MEELTILDLFDIFTDNIKVIVSTMIISIIISIIYTTLILTPMYESSTKVILVKSGESSNALNLGSGMTVNDIMLNQKLVSTYSEIIKSRTVLNEVINVLKLEDKPEILVKNITVTPVKDSEVINIKVENEDPNKASDIANEIILSFAKQVKDIYNIENVNQVDKAVPSEKPNNVSLIKNIALFAIIAFMLSYGICFLLEYFRTTLKSPEDIEKIDGLSVLSIIPDIDREEIS